MDLRVAIGRSKGSKKGRPRGFLTDLPDWRSSGKNYFRADGGSEQAYGVFRLVLHGMEIIYTISDVTAASDDRHSVTSNGTVCLCWISLTSIIT